MASNESRRNYFRRRWVSRLVRSFRKRYFRLRYGKKPFVASYYGAYFHIDLVDSIARNIAYRSLEWAQLNHMIRACQRLKPSYFIDIGANCGLYTCILGIRETEAEIISVEPDARNFARLIANIELNKLKNVRPLQVALGEQRGTAKLNSGPQTQTGWSKISADGIGYEVDVIALDDLIQETGKVIAIKIDVEGQEKAVIRGMKKLLAGNTGIVQVESSTTRDSVIEEMRSLGFTLDQEFHFDLIFKKH